jgi:uncharacterized membrane protein
MIVLFRMKKLTKTSYVQMVIRLSVHGLFLLCRGHHATVHRMSHPGDAHGAFAPAVACSARFRRLVVSVVRLVFFVD